MSPAGALRSLVVSAAAAPPSPSKDQPETRTALLWPVGILPKNPKELGPLTLPVLNAPGLTSEGGVAHEASGRPRVCVYLGLGTTLRGLGRALTNLFSGLDGNAAQVMDPEQLARAILGYNDRYLSPTEALFNQVWRAGQRVPLPLELWLTQWSTSLGQLDVLANQYTPEWERVLDTPAAVLPIPDPIALSTEVEEWYSVTPVDLLAGELRLSILENPFAPVFKLVELMHQLSPQPKERAELVLKVLNGMMPFQLEILGWCTAGHAILRQFWHALTAPGAAVADAAALAKALEMVGQALGLTVDKVSPTGFKDPLVSGPSVLPRELPLSEKQASRGDKSQRKTMDANSEDNRGLHTMVLGRDVHVGYLEGGGFRGPAYLGRLNPQTFHARCSADILEKTPDRFKERLEIVVAISEIEGNLDACRAADKGLISTGIQQWTMHYNTEMTPLLQRFRDRTPEGFDLFFGMYGLQTKPWMEKDSKEAESPSDADIRNANPDYDPLAPAASSYPLYVALEQVPPKKERVLLKVGEDARVAFLGGKRDEKKSQVLLSPEWCARVRLAALCSKDYDIVQIQSAVYRFTRIKRQLGGIKFKVKEQLHTIQELCTSQFAAAILLDQHINAPDFVRASIQKACDQTAESLKAVSPHEPASTRLTNDFLSSFALNYLQLRTFRPDANKPRRDELLTKKHDKGLSSARDSFKGW